MTIDRVKCDNYFKTESVKNYNIFYFYEKQKYHKKAQKPKELSQSVSLIYALTVSD
jgi:hypothetical protein